MDLVAFLVGLGFLALASWHDIRTREVPDLVSYGLLLFAVPYGLAKGLLLASWVPVLQMLLGAAAGIGLGFALFYLGQWGGADSKLLMGLGALLGLGFGTYALLLFIVLALFAGAAYGILYAAWLALRERAAFVRKFKALIREPAIHRLRMAVIIGCFLLLFAALFLPGYRLLLAGATLGIYALFYLWFCIKVVEQAILIKEYPTGRLSEGDWILKDVVVRGKRVCGPKDLGVSKAQIATLKRLKVRKVWVKEGIPFVPSFLIALLLFWMFSPALTALVAALF